MPWSYREGRHGHIIDERLHSQDEERESEGDGLRDLVSHGADSGGRGAMGGKGCNLQQL
jgi:hypothetical protein